ncbi:MAG TPA: IclR family transcriptional regulator [Spirochaetales bacterium]|nr:IclR family transcriptional regulator [Spirochaetales bacterium]HRY55498.1 IclR family transcriptional regulator [Spirochaetia bacterium]HRZ64523.1 IclR family transcriptional regulator [Spirochaetia bacterium]
MLERDSSVRAVERALDILDCFVPGRLELSLTEIAKRIDLAMSTTSRLVWTLEKRGYLARSAETQRFELGPTIAQIGAVGYANIDLRKVALPFMAALNKIYDEGVSLYVVQGDERVCVERVESSQPLRRVINVGDRNLLTRGAAGRVLLAYQPEAKRRALLAGDPFTTEEALAELRHSGYTVSLGEREEGVTSIAAPVQDARREVVAALSMSGPSVRFEGPGYADKVGKVKKHAELISEALGRRPAS